MTKQRVAEQTFATMEPVATYTRNTQLLRRATSLLVADRRHLVEWQSVIVATAQANRWVSAGLRQRAVSAREQAELLRADSARLQAQAMEQRQRTGWSSAEAPYRPRHLQPSLAEFPAGFAVKTPLTGRD